MEDNLHGRCPQWKMTSLAENNREQVEIAQNEERLFQNSFRAKNNRSQTMGNFCAEGIRHPWKTTFCE